MFSKKKEEQLVFFGKLFQGLDMRRISHMAFNLMWKIAGSRSAGDFSQNVWHS